MREPLRLLSITGAALALALMLHPLAAIADPTGDLQKMGEAFGALKSWHAEMQFPNGRSLSMDYAGPDHLRILMHPQGGEAIIGDHMYVNNKGKWIEIPSFAARIASGRIRKNIPHTAQMDTIDPASVKDLGMQPLNGKSYHAYSFSTKDGASEEVWLLPNSLPARYVVTTNKLTTTVDYSQYNAVSVDAP